MNIYLDSIGVIAPGMANWSEAIKTLTGVQAFAIHAPLPDFNVTDLPATERRRAGKSVKLAVDLAAQAMASAFIDPILPAAVFASTSGDTEVLTDICAALATDDHLISPMRFHNSVHNAASGYWTIAQQNRQPATAVALHNLTASAGLLEAAAQAVAENVPVLLVIYDMPFPPPLDAAEPIAAVFGMSFLLQPARTPHSMAQLSISLSMAESQTVNVMDNPELEALRIGVAAARGLPLLAALASVFSSGWVSGNVQTVVLEYVSPQVLIIAVQPIISGEPNT